MIILTLSLLLISLTFCETALIDTYECPDCTEINDPTNKHFIKVKMTRFDFDFDKLDSNQIEIMTKTEEYIRFIFCEGKKFSYRKGANSINTYWKIPIEPTMSNLVQLVSKQGISCVIIGDNHVYSFKVFNGDDKPHAKKYQDIETDKLSDAKYYIWIQILIVFGTIFTLFLLCFFTMCFKGKLKKL